MDFLNALITFCTSDIMIDTVTKLSVAIILSLLIGIEREAVHKPAGIKTHMLICMSATLVMSLGVYLFEKYPDRLDPSRLPAQILAGIGFVGAGTIIRDGFSVKGITTAASLLAITCIGLAIGAGFYEGAILATVFVFLALYLTTPIHQLLNRNKKIVLFTITAKSSSEVLGKINTFFVKNNTTVLNIKQIHDDASQYTLLKFSVKLDSPKQKEFLTHELCELPEIKEVFVSKKTYQIESDSE
ncbi:MAG: MgtC/SapB family protein [Clostridia bacterium]|nr:MgtC/SapB family protein [Clostridia bacterium]